MHESEIINGWLVKLLSILLLSQVKWLSQHNDARRCNGKQICAM